MELNIGLVVEAVAAAVPDREAVVQGEVRRTYADLVDRSRRLAGVLHAARLGAHGDPTAVPGHETVQDLVLLLSGNRPEYVEGMVGSYHARCAPANVNYRYTVSELAYLVGDSRARGAIVERRYAAALAEAYEEARVVPAVRLVLEDGSGSEVPDGWDDYEAALAAAAPLVPGVDLEPTPDDLYVVFTGGTTGMPKGVLWRQCDFLAGALGVTAPYEELAAGARKEGRAALRAFAAPPLMHGAAHWNAISCLANGGTVVLSSHGDRFDVVDVLDALERERCTSLNVVGDAFVRPLLDEQARHPRDLSSLRHVISGGAVFSDHLKRRFVEEVEGLRIIDIVGSSESGRQAMASGTSTGRFTAEGGAAVLDDTRTRRLEAGSAELGWLATCGPIPRGYLGDPAKTAATFPVVDGVRYVVAGDRARIGADGAIELLGRESTTINTGGEKVFAEEVELAVRTHPAVADALVVGRPSARWGQEVVAVVALRDADEDPGDDALREAAAAAGLARYKLPKVFLRVPAVQRTASGKADIAWARGVAGDAPA